MVSLACARPSFGDIKIKGKTVQELKDGDTIYFSNGELDGKYFDERLTASEIKDQEFELTLKLSYPHMFKTNLKSEKGRIVLRGGEYFIDRSTSTITLDSIGECSFVSGRTQKEFKERFVPFMMKPDLYDCKESSLGILRYFNGQEHDQKLVKYIEEYPDSFVALWFLIERIETEGHTQSYQKALQLFSKDMKREKLWQMAQETLESICIKENDPFPVLQVKDTSLTLVGLQLPKARYTLVDYWFNNCRPCLEAFPKIQQLYGKYHAKGFEVIGISVDRTEHIGKWKQRIKDEGLKWPQYLDENGIKTKKDRITVFPTTFLLNEKGEVVKKNIPLEKLEKLLKNNMH